MSTPTLKPDKPTMRQYDFKMAVIRKAELKKEITTGKKARRIIKIN